MNILNIKKVNISNFIYFSTRSFASKFARTAGKNKKKNPKKSVDLMEGYKIVQKYKPRA